MYKTRGIILIIAALSLNGCLTLPKVSADSVPLAHPAEDKSAKLFTPDPGMANIYLYRNESFGRVVAMPVALNGVIVGSTGPHTYFLWSVDPGTHKIESLTENTAQIVIDAQAGKSYYIWQEVKSGWRDPRSRLHPVTDNEGIAAIKECQLIASKP